MRCGVQSITTAKVNNYAKTRLEQGAKPATVNRELSALGKAFSLAARSTPPKVAQVPFISKLEEDNVREGFFEHGEFLKVRNALTSPIQPVVTFAYKTGWRKSEILNLTWSRVPMVGGKDGRPEVEGTIRLEGRKTKNKTAKNLYLDSELKEMFQGLWESWRLGCPYVFHRDGEQIKYFKNTWHAALKGAHLEHRLFHDFRRTAVRNMIRSGIPERVAMMVSGHKTRSVFDRYNIVNEEDLKMAAEKQEAYLDRQATEGLGDNLVAIGGSDDE